MLLYKYCDAGGIEILHSASILLKRPRAFNDPFDLNPYISKFDDAALMGDYVFNKLRDIVVPSLAENCDSLLMWAHYADRRSPRGSIRAVPPSPAFDRFEVGPMLSPPQRRHAN